MNNNELFLRAAKNHDLVGVKNKVGNGANVNFTDAAGRSALMFAAVNSDSAMVEFLIKNGADVNAKDQEGWTALSFAEELHYPVISGILRQHGAVDVGFFESLQAKMAIYAEYVQDLLGEEADSSEI